MSLKYLSVIVCGCCAISPYEHWTFFLFVMELPPLHWSPVGFPVTPADLTSLCTPVCVPAEAAEAGGVSLAPGRAKCNSVLHLFGAWLFEAALVGTSAHSSAKHTQGR